MTNPATPEQERAAVVATIQQLSKMVPADVLASRFAKYAEAYRARAENLPWWKRWERGLFFGAYAAMKVESEVLAKLTALNAIERLEHHGGEG